MVEIDEARPETYIVGDLGSGAYGPTILVVLRSPRAVAWLRSVFLGMVGSDACVDLTRQEGVLLGRVGSLELRRVEREPTKSLHRKADASGFVWSGSDAAWRRNAGLLDPFIEGQSGHQYLTSEDMDDALIEVSFGEPEVSLQL